MFTFICTVVIHVSNYCGCIISSQLLFLYYNLSNTYILHNRALSQGNSSQTSTRTFLTSESMTVCAIYIVPSILMIVKETKSVDTILIMKVVWLVFRPVVEIKR